MAALAIEIISGAYEKLGNPKTTDLSVGFAYSRLAEVLEYYLNMLNMSDSNWILGNAKVDVSAGVDTYSLANIEDFGKAVVIETTSSNNELFLRRTLQIVDKQDINPLRIEPILSTAVTTPYYKHNSLKCAFWMDKDLGIMQVQFEPTPLAACTYKIFYEPLGLATPSISGNVVFLNNFMGLLKTATALKCLPMLVETMSQLKFKALSDSLSMELAKLETQFSVYIMTDHQEFAGPITPYNNSQWY